MTPVKSGTVREPGGQPPAPPRAGRNLLVGAALVALPVAAALACCSVYAGWLPSDRAQYREYEAAGTCPARRVIPRVEDCLRDIAFTVEDTSLGARTKRATLLGTEPFSKVVVPFGDSEPVLRGLQQGDRVTGTVRRGLVVVVREGDARQNSRDEPQMIAAVGVRSRGCSPHGR